MQNTEEKNEVLEIIEKTPKHITLKCRVLVYALTATLKLSTLVVALIFWYFFDFFTAFVALLLSFIIVGIVRSKLRSLSIPLHQLEYDYNDFEIASWYVNKWICHEI